MPRPEDLEEHEEAAISQQPKANYESVEQTEARPRDKSSPIPLGPGPSAGGPAVFPEETSDKEPIVSIELSEDDVNNSS